MLIHEVMARTGLTRKAIYYYEQHGLLRPGGSGLSSYRHYTEEDARRLLWIRELRRLGLPVASIRQLLDQPEQASAVIRTHLTDLDGSIGSLQKARERSRQMLQRLETEPAAVSAALDELTAAEQGEDAEERKCPGYAVRKLPELFPGGFGAYLACHFGAFLQEAFTRSEQEQAWRQAVRYLDESPPFELPEALAAVFEDLDTEEIVRMAEANSRHIRKFIRPSETQYQALKTEVLAMADRKAKLTGQEEAKLGMELRQKLSGHSYYAEWVERMKVISEDYREYHVTLERLQRDTGLRYTDEGEITRE